MHLVSDVAGSRLSLSHPSGVLRSHLGSVPDLSCPQCSPSRSTLRVGRAHFRPASKRSLCREASQREGAARSLWSSQDLTNRWSQPLAVVMKGWRMIYEGWSESKARRRQRWLSSVSLGASTGMKPADQWSDGCPNNGAKYSSDVRFRPGWADLGLSFCPQPTSTINHFGGGS